ncbi:MAG: methyl-accepting chemotaxis protein, partial [Deltaproteobacteria bacterium]
RTKILAYAIILWVLIFGVYSAITYKQRIEQVRRSALSTAALLSKEIMTNRGFYTATVVKRALDLGVPVTSVFHGDLEGAIPLPAVFLKEIASSLKENNGFIIDLRSLNPINPANTAVDEFQTQSIEGFTKGSESVRHVFTEQAGKRSLRYMVPDVATSKVCVDCHNANPASHRKDYKVGDVMGGLEVMVPIEAELAVAMGDVSRAMGYGLAAIVVMGFASLVFLRKVVTDPLFDISDAADALASGDLSATAHSSAKDEMGLLAKSINDAASNLKAMVTEVRSASIQADMISVKAKDISRHFLDVSSRQGEGLDKTVSLMEGVQNAAVDLSRAAAGLDSSVAKCADSMLALGGRIHEVEESMDALFVNSVETARSTKDMSIATREISEHIGNLSEAAAQVSSSVAEITGRIATEDANAAEACRLAEDVITDAKSGAVSMDALASGIENIRGSTRESTVIMEGLCSKVKEVGRILDVIRDVAEETNLLAVNAAIIAAQSGEHGKSFSVVSGEIKDLAERTSVSAKEMAGLMLAVDDESARAGAAIGKGMAVVEHGVRLANEASEALKKIVESAKRSTASVHEIARASREESEESRRAAEAAGNIAEKARRIASSAEEQARGSELINRSSERISEIAYKVKDAALKQVEANVEITAAMEEVKVMAVRMESLLREQARGIAKAMESSSSVRGMASENIKKAVSADSLAEEMAKLNNELSEALKRFKPVGKAQFLLQEHGESNIIKNHGPAGT